MEDAHAVSRCLSGDQDAFRALVEKYQHRALGHALALLRNRDDALDAVQDALVSAYHGLRGFDRSRPFYPWLYAILRRRCLKALERRHRDVARTGTDPDLLVSRGLAHDEQLGLVRALESLAPTDREIITLRHLDGLSYGELAQYLDIPLGTVMSRLHTARARMRAILKTGSEPGR